MDNKSLLFFNGINGERGDYDLPPMPADTLARIAQGESAPTNLSELKIRHQWKEQASYSVVEGADPRDLSQCGWGVIFPARGNPAIREALTDLFNLRRRQAGDLYREYQGQEGYRASESKNEFLGRHNVGPGPANPRLVPYHLLLVGSPEEIPYEFQQALALNYSVGRIYFEALEDYQNYARSVTAAETGQVRLAREMAFFAPQAADDQATQISTGELICPLSQMFSPMFPDWKFQAHLAQDATKATLNQLLNGGSPPAPALLMAAAHGMSFPSGSDRQAVHQGALLCQDWPGPSQWRSAIPHNHYFAGEDLSSDANLLGSMVIFFASYGLGAPQLDAFAQQALRSRSSAGNSIAPAPFLAQLPTRMLSRPRGGALAVIGQAERAWSYSAPGMDNRAQTAIYKALIYALISGQPAGAAVGNFSERYAEQSYQLNSLLEEADFGRELDPLELISNWTAAKDARSLILLGDPAVRLPVAGPDEAPRERPDAIQLTQIAEFSSTGPIPTATAEVTTEAIQPVSPGWPGAQTTSAGDFNLAGDFAGSSAPPVGPPAGSDWQGVSFGLFENVTSTADTMNQFIKKFVGMLSESLDMASIQVRTYLVEDADQEKALREGASSAQLLATTQVKIDGDIDNYLSKTGNEENLELLKIHTEMVEKAQTYRVELLKAMAVAVGSLMPPPDAK